MTAYYPAPEVEKVARLLIDEHHPDLTDADIVYVFRDPPAKTGGKEQWGKARKITGLNAYLAEHHAFLVVEIALDIWKSLTPAEQHALVDHELCHCDWDPHHGPSIVPHDIEEFVAVVSRHGLWNPEVNRIVHVGQLRLDLEAGDATS